MKRTILAIYLWVILIITGCAEKHVESILSNVEAYIMERPDSALSVIDSIDRNLLSTNRLKAHHALLHAMALDKNLIDVDDDSLARVALDYYSKRGPEKYKARALYYLGLSYYNAGEYDKAIIEFTKAEKIAVKCDSLYLGLINSIQSHTYFTTYNEEEAIRYIKQAKDIFADLSMEHYVNISELNLAKLYFNYNDVSNADSLFTRLINSDSVDEEIRSAAMQCQAFMSISREDPDYEWAIETYESLMNDYDASYMSYKDYWAYAYALAYTGRETDSYDLIFQLKQVDSSTTAYYWQYLVKKHEGNFSDALALLETSVTYNNDELVEALKQSLALSQRDFYKSEFENAEYKSNNRRLLVISIAIAAILLIVSILWATSARIKNQKEEKEYYLKYAAEILSQLEASKNEDYPKLKRQYLEIYKSRFEMIGTLYEEYVLYSGKKNAEHAVYEKVSKMVDAFVNDDKNKKQLESVLNESLDGIISRLRQEMPRLKEMDYSIFCYMIIGFDSTTISHLLNTSLNTVYIRKTRMRQFIKEQNPKNMERFLEILG